MKTILASVVLTLATYAQAACAEDYHISVFKQSQSFHQSSQHTVQPTWLIGQQGKPQIIGFTQITRTQQLADNTNESVQHTLGVGMHQQITPFMYTQMLITQERGGQSAVKIGVEF